MYSVKVINNTEWETLNENVSMICYYLNLFCNNK